MVPPRGTADARAAESGKSRIGLAAACVDDLCDLVPRGQAVEAAKGDQPRPQSGEMQPAILPAEIEQGVAVRFELRPDDAADED